MGNPELLNSWTPYVYISMVLYGWLVAAAALHIPVNSLGQLGATIKQPVLLTCSTMRLAIGASWVYGERVCVYCFVCRSRCSSRSSQ